MATKANVDVLLRLCEDDLDRLEMLICRFEKAVEKVEKQLNVRPRVENAVPLVDVDRPEAVTLVCDQCGGTIDVPDDEHVSFCPSCGTRLGS